MKRWMKFKFVVVQTLKAPFIWWTCRQLGRQLGGPPEGFKSLRRGLSYGWRYRNF